jgi:hypothetical protein
MPSILNFNRYRATIYWDAQQEVTANSLNSMSLVSDVKNLLSQQIKLSRQSLKYTQWKIVIALIDRKLSHLIILRGWCGEARV